MDSVNTEGPNGIRILKKYTYKPRAVSVQNTQKLEQAHKIWIPWNRKVRYQNSANETTDRNISVCMVAHNHAFNLGLNPLMHVQCIGSYYFKDP